MEFNMVVDLSQITHNPDGSVTIGSPEPTYINGVSYTSSTINGDFLLELLTKKGISHESG